jgi:hypothetical protein
LEVDLVTPMTIAVAMLPAVLGATGCFDAHSVDPGPWVIDDFEDGDYQPFDRNFGSWDCYASGPSHLCSKAPVTPGDQGLYAMALDFTIGDPAGSGQQPGGASLQTLLPATPEDLSRFSEMVFSAKMPALPALAALPSSPVFYAELGCSTVQGDGYQTTAGNLYVRQDFPVTIDWKTVQLPKAGFLSSPYNDAHINGGPAACLQRVDNIHFEVQFELSDGQSAMGELSVDEIYFQ